ncbi:MAG: hypothetical protein HY899_06985 [Deltaproteobacteria bacterium]|nr:hypothetical protein [Deltaproteobacteria bacterium]
MDSGIFDRWAERERMSRPFAALADMASVDRRVIADLLKMDLETGWRDTAAIVLIGGEETISAAAIVEEMRETAEAAILIGADLTGIQARAHTAWRTLNPFTSNYTWFEVLESITTEFSITVPPPVLRGRDPSDALKGMCPRCQNWRYWANFGPSPTCCDVPFVSVTPVFNATIPETQFHREERYEAAITEWVAMKAWAELPAEEKERTEEFMTANPAWGNELRTSGFGNFGGKILVSGLLKRLMRQGFETYIQTVKAAGFLNRRLGTRILMKSATQSMKTFLRSLNVVMWAWLAKDLLEFAFGPSRRRLVPVVCQIHMDWLLSGMEYDDVDLPERVGTDGGGMNPSGLDPKKG